MIIVIDDDDDELKEVNDIHLFHKTQNWDSPTI